MNSSFDDWLFIVASEGSAAANPATRLELSAPALDGSISAVRDSGSWVVYPLELNFTTWAAKRFSKFFRVYEAERRVESR